jgi:acylaminoacyl-peptidase
MRTRILTAGTAVLMAATAALLAPPASALAQTDGPDRLRAMDVFDLEVGADPRISPDGDEVVYVRSGFDVMDDGRTTALWIVGSDGSGHRPLTDGSADVGSPRWSPSGDRLAYVSDGDESSEIRVRWMDTGQTTKITDLNESPSGLAWSPDGERIAFTMFVPAEEEPFTSKMPSPPEGADWGPPIRVTEDVRYKADGRGLVEPGHRHVFVVPAEGGTPRQLTSGDYDHADPTWTADGRALLLTANRREDRAYDPADTEIYAYTFEDGGLRALTDRHGPDGNPAVSPDGERIAYTGRDERYQGYQLTNLYVMDRDGSDRRRLLADLDRSVADPAWAPDGSGIFFRYEDQGRTKVGFVTLDGQRTDVARDVGGLSLGRPYGSGSFTVGGGHRIAFTHATPQRPADVAVARLGEPVADDRVVTRLNRDVLGHKALGQVEEIRYASSHDGRRIQGWIVKPPDFDPSETYPLILEIHGGPFAMYGPTFAAEIQLYAAAGYVVLYTNPRGSTGYGQEFGNLIHHAYPSRDYDDLMSGVDAVLERGYVDPDRLFVTGGSGGGVLTAWIVGSTDRFSAAVVQKPVINWYSWGLYADMYQTGVQYWFPGPPWEHEDHYMDRSPISRVGDVTTPTMVLTGEQDERTPMPESEQLYGALKLQKVPAALVRVPDASHGIASKPSNLIAKVAHVLEWFERHPRNGAAAGD